MPSNIQKPVKTVAIEDLAFWNGAHGIGLDETQREIHAIHQKEQSKLKEESAKRQKPIEAIVQHMEQMRPQVERVWADIQRRFGLHPPPVVEALVVAFFAVGAQVVDGILLAPCLDFAGISNPVAQYITAFGLAASFSGILHMAYKKITRPASSDGERMLWRIVAIAIAAGLVVVGLLRGIGTKFSADLHGNPLGGFLGGHAIISSLFFCLVSLATPLFGAAAFAYAGPRIRSWFTWRKAKREHEGLHATLRGAQKKLEAERADLKHKCDQLDAERTIWKATAAQYHERGKQRGALQEPAWMVPAKATAWSLVGLAAATLIGSFLVGPVLVGAYIALPAGAGIAAYVFYHRRREHPGYKRFRKQEYPRFAVKTAERPLIEMPKEPKMLSAPREEKK
jgi:hypothetical protein